MDKVLPAEAERCICGTVSTPVSACQMKDSSSAAVGSVLRRLCPAGDGKVHHQVRPYHHTHRPLLVDDIGPALGTLPTCRVLTLTCFSMDSAASTPRPAVSSLSSALLLSFTLSLNTLQESDAR